MASEPSKLEVVAVEAEGEAAARSGQTFRDDCPYGFVRVGVDQLTFDREWRWKLNAWFRGWKRATDDGTRHGQ